jgi:hypothetical protein
MSVLECETMIANFKLLSLSILAGSLLSSVAYGTTVGAGTFNLSGTAIGTTTGIDFYLHSPGDQQGSINLPTSGVFMDLMPTTVETIHNLTSANGVTPGTPFNFVNWIQLTDGIDLDATSIPIPSFPVCTTASPETTGYQCLVNGLSPVVLTKTNDGVAARINIYGNAHYDGQSTETPFIALFTSPTTDFATIADFETYFDANHAIPALSYSASFTTPSAVPEPAALSMTCVGLIGFGLMRRRKKVSPKTTA